jgi:hypothetical protein
MTFAAPLGLLALLAIPAIVAIHLLRRRFPVRPTAGLFLWNVAHDVPDGGRRVDKLPWTLSLMLECIAALALGLIIAGATLSSSSDNRHLVVLLDDSVSMTAVNTAGESPRDRATRRVLDEVERLGPRGRITLVRSGERPAVIAGPAAFTPEARPALASWRPLARQHSLSAGLRLARELSGGSGAVLILSDRAPDGAAEQIIAGEEWAAVGTPLPNLGIVDAHRASEYVAAGFSRPSASGTGATLSLTLRNSSDAAASRVLRVTAGAAEVAVRKVEGPPGISSLTIPLPAGLPPLTASLSDDALAADNAVVLVEPRPQIVAVENRLTGSRGNAALDKALDAIAGATKSGSGHLAFVEGNDSAVRPGTWQVRFGGPGVAGVPGDAGHAGSNDADLIGPFVLEKRHPLMQGVTLGGVVWTGVRALASGSVRPIASAGDSVLVGTLTSGAAAADPVFVFNLDLARTNLIRSPDWPILISNLVEMRRRELPGPERWNYRVGEWVRVRLDRPPASPLRLRMGALERDLPQTRVVEFTAPAPGGLAQILEGDQVRFEIGINPLDETEGDLRAAGTSTIGGLDDSGAARLEGGAAFDPIFWALLAVCAAAMIGNWCLPYRRVRA